MRMVKCDVWKLEVSEMMVAVCCSFTTGVDSNACRVNGVMPSLGPASCDDPLFLWVGQTPKTSEPKKINEEV